MKLSYAMCFVGGGLRVKIQNYRLLTFITKGATMRMTDYKPVTFVNTSE